MILIVFRSKFASIFLRYAPFLIHKGTDLQITYRYLQINFEQNPRNLYAICTQSVHLYSLFYYVIPQNTKSHLDNSDHQCDLLHGYLDF